MREARRWQRLRVVREVAELRGSARGRRRTRRVDVPIGATSTLWSEPDGRRARPDLRLAVKKTRAPAQPKVSGSPDRADNSAHLSWQGFFKQTRARCTGPGRVAVGLWFAHSSRRRVEECTRSRARGACAAWLPLDGDHTHVLLVACVWEENGSARVEGFCGLPNSNGTTCRGETRTTCPTRAYQYLLAVEQRSSHVQVSHGRSRRERFARPASVEGGTAPLQLLWPDEQMHAREATPARLSTCCSSPAVDVEATGPVEFPLTDEAVPSSMGGAVRCGPYRRVD